MHCLFHSGKFQCHLAWQENGMSNLLDPQEPEGPAGLRVQDKAEAMCLHPEAEPTTGLQLSGKQEVQVSLGGSRGARSEELRPEAKRGLSKAKGPLRHGHS